MVVNDSSSMGFIKKIVTMTVPAKCVTKELTVNFISILRFERWQDEVREDGRIVGGEGWQEKVHNKEEWKKLLRTARNRRILHTLMEC